MHEHIRLKLKELRRELAKHHEHHVAGWERKTSPEAQMEVASFLGRVRLEWFIADRMREGR